MGKLSDREMTNCIRLLNEGYTTYAVANFYGVSQSLISRLKLRFAETQRVNYRHGGGSQRLLTPREERILLRDVARNRTQNSRKLNIAFRRQTGILISDRTVRRTLNHNNLRY